MSKIRQKIDIFFRYVDSLNISEEFGEEASHILVCNVDE